MIKSTEFNSRSDWYWTHKSYRNVLFTNTLLVINEKYDFLGCKPYINSCLILVHGDYFD